jgi:hypothetical protein
MTPISKIKKSVVEDVRNFKSKWKCCFNDPPPKGSKIFALMICKDIYPSTKFDEDNAPNVVHVYVGEEIPYPCSRYYFIGPGDGSGGKIPPSNDSVFERREYELILWIDENDYYNFSMSVNEYNPNPWIFVKEYDGNYEEAFQEMAKLQENDPEYDYRIWDDRNV